MDFDDIVLEIIDKLAVGEAIDIEKYFNEYPQYKEALLIKFRTANFIKKNFQEENLSDKKLGEYIILQELGRGGMGIVFLAIQPSLSRLTALKILPSSFAYEEESLKNFQEEAKIIAKFNHPNIIPVYSIGNEKGINYISMGYIPGSSLKNLIEMFRNIKEIENLKVFNIKNILEPISLEKEDISQRSISLKRNPTFWNKSYFQFAATIGAEISEAINYAHQNGIFHGDLKPSNILLTNELIPMIADFGLSKDIKKLSSYESKEFTGTLAYAAPEQIKDNKINEKTDIWSLGVTLYELLTSRNPFLDKNVEKTVSNILRFDPLSLKKYNKKIPIELEAIVLKCLQKKPENRYKSALELSQDLNNYLESKPIKAKPISIIGKTKKWAKRHPIVAGFTSIFLLVIIASLFLSYNIRLARLADLGTELQYAGKFKDAQNVFNKVLALAVKTPFTTKTREKALLGLASLYSKDEPRKSLEYYKKCLEVNPKKIQALSGIARVYENLGNYTDSIKYYERLMTINAGHISNLLYPGLLYELGQIDEADKCYGRILAAEPNDPYIISDYVRFLKRIGRSNQILEFLAKKCEKEEIANDASIQFGIIFALEDIIKKSRYLLVPIDTFSKAKEFLISKGFKEKYAEYIIEKNVDTLGFLLKKY